jgi:hypothetical protein
MKKKLLLITGLLLLATAAFAFDREKVMRNLEFQDMWISSGSKAFVIYCYAEKYESQTLVNNMISTGDSSPKPSGEYWELINKVLNGYDTAKGDTFVIVITFFGGTTTGSFICEYTSATKYNYWFFNKLIIVEENGKT